MNGFLLDTNFVSELVRIRPDPVAVAWMAEFQKDESALHLSALTLGEIRKGIDGLQLDDRRRSGLESWLNRDLPARFSRRIIAIDGPIAIRWGTLQRELERRGTPIGAVDALIAATALRHDLAVVTRNVKHFQRTGALCVSPWGDA